MSPSKYHMSSWRHLREFCFCKFPSSCPSLQISFLSRTPTCKKWKSPNCSSKLNKSNFLTNTFLLNLKDKCLTEEKWYLSLGYVRCNCATLLEKLLAWKIVGKQPNYWLFLISRIKTKMMYSLPFLKMSLISKATQNRHELPQAIRCVTYCTCCGNNRLRLRQTASLHAIQRDVSSSLV